MTHTTGFGKGFTPNAGFVFVEIAENQRTQITRFQTAVADKFDRRIAKIFPLEFMIHSINFGGITESLHMFGKTEDRRTFRRLITADAFKNARPVIDDVRHHVNSCIIPVNKFAVAPDFGRDLFRINIFCCHKFL